MVEASFIWADLHPKQARVLILFHYYCVAKSIQLMMTGAILEMLTTDSKRESFDYRKLAMKKCRELAIEFIADGGHAVLEEST